MVVDPVVDDVGPVVIDVLPESLSVLLAPKAGQFPLSS
jgi:hypothetical protein